MQSVNHADAEDIMTSQLEEKELKLNFNLNLEDVSDRQKEESKAEPNQDAQTESPREYKKLENKHTQKAPFAAKSLSIGPGELSSMVASCWTAIELMKGKNKQKLTATTLKNCHKNIFRKFEPKVRSSDRTYEEAISAQFKQENRQIKMTNLLAQTSEAHDQVADNHFRNRSHDHIMVMNSPDHHQLDEEDRSNT